MKQMKVIKILQGLVESDPRAYPKHQEKDGQKYLNKQQNYRWLTELAALSQTGGNSITCTELNKLDTQKC